MDELSRLGWAAQRSFEVGGLLFGLRSNSRRVLHWAEEVLGPYRDDDAEAGPYYSVLLGGSDGGVGKRFHILYRESDAIARSHDLGAVGHGLLADIESLTFRHRRDALYLDAPLLSGQGANVVVSTDLAGFFNRPGKKLSQAGITFPLAWTTAIDLEGSAAVSPPPILDLPADAVDRLRALAPNGRPAATPVQAATQPVHAICFSSHDVEEAAAPMSPARAVYRLGQMTRNLGTLEGHALDVLTRLVERVPCFELKSDFYDPMLETLADVMRQVAPAGVSFL